MCVTKIAVVEVILVLYCYTSIHMHVLRVWILLSSRAIAWSPHPAGMRPKYISLPSKSSPVASESGGDLNFASRIESGKAAICSTVAGTVAATPFLLLAPGAFRAPEWEFQADGLPIMLFLFGMCEPIASVCTNAYYGGHQQMRDYF